MDRKELAVSIRHFEYKVINTLETGVPMSNDNGQGNTKRIEEELNVLGAQGWELCSMCQVHFIFCRELLE